MIAGRFYWKNQWTLKWLLIIKFCERKKFSGPIFKYEFHTENLSNSFSSKISTFWRKMTKISAQKYRWDKCISEYLMFKTAKILIFTKEVNAICDKSSSKPIIFDNKQLLIQLMIQRCRNFAQCNWKGHSVLEECFPQNVFKIALSEQQLYLSAIDWRRWAIIFLSCVSQNATIPSSYALFPL